MSSKRSHEGYVMVDQRASGHGLFESASITCSHCHRVVVLNPDRTRPREYCSKCDHYICDGCGAIRKQTGECSPLNAVFDQMQAKEFRTEQHNRMLAAPAPVTLSPKENS